MPDTIQQLTNLKRSIEAMKGAGQSDDLIIDRISKRTDIPDEIKMIFSDLKRSGQSAKAVNDFLQVPLDTSADIAPMRSLAESEGEVGSIGRIKKNIGQAAEFIGAEPLARTIAGRSMGLTQEQTGVTPRELAGSAIQTGATLALPFMGKTLQGAKFGERLVSSAGTQAGLGIAAEMTRGGKDLTGAGIFGGIIGTIIPLGGLVFRGVNNVIKGFPKTAYTKIFKDTIDDMSKNFDTKALTQEINPTLAEEMLNSAKTLGREISGNAEEMGVVLTQVRNTIGKSLDVIADNAPKDIRIPIKNKKHLINVLEEIRKGLKESLVPEQSAEAQKYIEFLKQVKPQDLSVRQALDLKQFIDNARGLSSFKIDAKLAPKQQAFKDMADYFRGQLHKKYSPMSKALNAYRISIEGREAVVREAVSEGNQALLNRLDALAIGAGAMAGQPAITAAASGVIRASRSPAILTKSAQAVRKLTEGIEKPRSLGITRNLQGVPQEQLNVLGRILQTGPRSSIGQNIQQGGRVFGRRILSGD